MMTVWLVLLCILLSGRPLLTLSGGVLIERFGIVPGFQDLHGCGLLTGFKCLLLVLETLLLLPGLSQ